MNNSTQNVLGERLKKVRTFRGLTQSQLAEGICTQAQISNIEKGTGKENTSSQILYLLSERLDVDMSYLYGQRDEPSYLVNENFKQIKALIENLKSHRDYSSLNYVIQNELSNKKNKFASEFEQQFLYWHQAICTYYLEHDIEKAIDFFNKALSAISHYDTLESKIQYIEVKTSFGIILQEEKRYADSIQTLQECLDLNHELNQSHNKDKIHPKILFNLSINYTMQKMYNKALSLCLDAIDICLANDSLYLLGDVLYQAGYNYYMLDYKKEGLGYMERATVIFEIQKNSKIVQYIKNKIRELTQIPSSKIE